jgi:hypothetical protein
VQSARRPPEIGRIDLSDMDEDQRRSLPQFKKLLEEEQRTGTGDDDPTLIDETLALSIRGRFQMPKFS